MSTDDVAAIAIGAIVVVVGAEHFAIWSLFWKRGWRIIAPVQKQAQQTTAEATPGEAQPPVRAA